MPKPPLRCRALGVGATEAESSRRDVGLPRCRRAADPSALGQLFRRETEECVPDSFRLPVFGVTDFTDVETIA
jgi:hypothetical protein